MLHRYVVLVNCALGVAGVSIQLGLLLPWHEVISHDVQKLTAETTALQNEVQQLKATIMTLNGRTAATPKSSSWWSWR